MAALTYFFARRRADELRKGPRLSIDALRAHGLEHLADVEDVAAECSLFDLKGTGPGGHSGAMLTVLPRAAGGGTRPPARLGYFPDLQRWEHVVDRGDEQLWIGVDTEDPPQPEDLQRNTSPQGYLCQLADGHRWTIPVLRRPDGSTGLRRDMYWDNGRFVSEVKREHRELWEQAAFACEFFQEGRAIQEADYEQAVGLCVAALGLHYRYGRHEHRVLRLVDSQNWVTLLALLVDWPTLLAVQSAQKKSSSPEELS